MCDMNRSMFIVLVLILCFQAQAQYVEPGTSPAERKIIEACQKNIESYNKKYSIYISSFYYCNNEPETRRRVNLNVALFDSCIQKAVPYVANKNDVLDVCFIDNFRVLINQPKFISCLKVTKPGSVITDDQYRKCSTKEKMEYFSSEIFNSCLAAHPTAFQFSSATSAFNFCEFSENANSLVGPEFVACRKQMLTFGLDGNDASRYCADKNNQRPEKIAGVATCLTRLKEIVGTPILDICVADRFAYNQRVASPEDLICLEKTSKKNLDPTYFIDEAEVDERTKKVQEIMSSCSQGSQGRSGNGAELRNEFVKFVGMKVISSNKVFDKTKVGGLSGLAYDAITNKLIAVSDDPGFNNPSRLYGLDVDLSGDISLKFFSQTQIKTQSSPDIKKEVYMDPRDLRSPTKPVLIHNIDAEGVALLPNDLMAISSETQIQGETSYIRLYKRDGTYVSDIETPKKFLPREELKTYTNKWTEYVWEDDPNCKPKEVTIEITHKDGSVETKHETKPCAQIQVQRQRSSNWSKLEKVAGVFPNNVFEALGSVTGKDILFTANESPLFQDSVKDKRLVRIVKLVREKNTYVPAGEFLYNLDNKEGNGLVDILPITEDRLLILERRFSNNSRRITAQIFEVNLRGAKDYSEIDSLSKEVKEEDLFVLKKQLLINMTDILPLLPDSFRTIDNLEGMALGPKLPNGKQSLILVSDNNFSKQQLTQFIILELNK